MANLSAYCYLFDMLASAKLLGSGGRELCRGRLSYNNINSLLFFPDGDLDGSQVEGQVEILLFGATGRFRVYKCSARLESKPYYFVLRLVPI